MIFEHLGLVFGIVSSQIFCRILVKSEAISLMDSASLFNFNFVEYNVLNLSQSAVPNFHFGIPEDPVVLYLTLSLMIIGRWSLPQVCCNTCDSDFALIVGDASVMSGVVS